jgi:hypothetical protein
MADTTPAAYSIVPWVRRGLASLVTGAATGAYASLPVSVAVNGTAVNVPPIRLLGPGDVTAIDARAVIRTDPRDGADAFEPNYLATVEFALPDFPWMFTPTGVSNGRLQPWLCLIVVPDAAGATLANGLGGASVLVLDAPLDPRVELPDLSTIDTWAHAQVTGAGLSGATLDAALDGDPATTLSRLIAARKLDANQGYIACVVPTYRAGVNAGLGLTVDETDLAPAWDATATAPLTLPVYYYFRFRTGPGGDFASLAQRITPAVAGANAGTRPVDFSAPGVGAPAASGLQLGLAGALRTTGNVPTPWPAGAQTPYEAALRAALNPPAAPDPVVAPPTYGRAQSGDGLPADGAKPVWLGDLNLDPRARCAASAGALVVQNEREALAGSAWDQLGDLRKANALLQRAQLARQVSSSLCARHLATVDDDGTYLQMTAPMHARVSVTLSGTNATLRGHIASSLLPLGAVSSALRKLARPHGPVGRQLTAGATGIVTRLNTPSGGTGALQVAAPLAAPHGMIAFDDVAPDVAIAKMIVPPLQSTSGWTVAATTIATTATTSHLEGATALEIKAEPVAPSTPEAPVEPVKASPIIDFSKDPNLPDVLKGTNVNLPAQFVFPSDPTEFAALGEQFRSAAAALGTYLNIAPAAPAPAAPLGGTAALSTARAQLALRIDPETTIAARTRARLPLGTGADPLQPIRTGPSFPQAMYAPLAALSPEWMLPGFSSIPMDCATVLVPNDAFVEAYMIGLNEELSRELLWRGFPADTQATYFQYFWGAGAPDIGAIGAFDPAGALGTHMADHANGNLIVFFVRASLFARYPNAVVSAVQAQWSGTVRTLSTTRQYPAFRGDIGPDVTFFGFELADPRGSDDPTKAQPGWYFVIEEHVTEARFGLEPAPPPAPSSVWNDLSWSDVTLGGAFLNPAVAPATPTREGVTFGQGSASMAFILLRRPVRVAMHALALLGPEQPAASPAASPA